MGRKQIERRFRRSGKLQAEVGRRLQEIADRGAELPQYEREDLQAEAVATLYSDTISRLSPRIVVNGRPQYLKAPRTVSWIRTMLFAGLRSAYLWDQLGGNRWRLMFGRKQMLADTEQLLSG